MKYAQLTVTVQKEACTSRPESRDQQMQLRLKVEVMHLSMLSLREGTPHICGAFDF